MHLTISIAICTFNGARYLPAQLRSIALQKRPPDELVICDDGSSDASSEIAAKFARSAPFEVSVFRNATNLGSTKNFEQAISFCHGTVIALADQDDIWYPDKLQTIENAFLFSPSTVGVFSDGDLIGPNSTPHHARLWDSFLFHPQERQRFGAGDAISVLIKHPVVTGATMAFRADLRHLLLPIPADQVHDRWLAFLLAASGPVTPIAQPLMQYRSHSSQQIGPGASTLRARFRDACDTGPDFYLEETAQFRQLAERLQQHRPLFHDAERALNEIHKKIAHREHRAHLPLSSITRIPRVFREMLNGGYWRYSEGWQSIVKDLTGVFAAQQTIEEPAMRLKKS